MRSIRGKYRISYGLQYDAWELAVQLPELELYESEEEVRRISEEQTVSALLTADAIFLFYGKLIQKFLPEQREFYQFSFLKEKAYDRLGPPLSPEDIDKLIEKDMLEEVIFSSQYILTENDYAEFQGDLSEAYREIRKTKKPGYRLPEKVADREGREICGYLFGSLWYKVELVKEAGYGY